MSLIPASSGGGSIKFDRGYGNTFSALKHIDDDTSAVSGTSIVFGFKPKKLMLYYYYQGVSIPNQLHLYDEDISDTTDVRYAYATAGSATEDKAYNYQYVFTINDNGITIVSGVNTANFRNICYMAIG